jgi:hypothetical protein
MRECKMYLVDKQYMALRSIFDWLLMHQHRKEFAEINKQLIELRERGDVKADEVDEVIGNDEWTRPPRCDMCSRCVDMVIRFELTEDDVHLCYECLKTGKSCFEIKKQPGCKF